MFEKFLFLLVQRIKSGSDARQNQSYDENLPHDADKIHHGAADFSLLNSCRPVGLTLRRDCHNNNHAGVARQ